MNTFAEIADAWLADVRLLRQPKTVQSYEIALAKFYAAVPAAKKRFITRADIVAFRNARAAKVSSHSANCDVKAIKACLAWAWTNELPHPQVPLRRLLLPVPPRKDETLSAKQIAKLFEAAALDSPVLVILKVCHGTGMRLGEALNLIWSDVDFEAGSITVSAKPWWTPKTPAALRTVFAPQLVEWLATYRTTLRRRGDENRVCQQQWHSGKSWTHRVHARLRAVYDRAGIVGKKPTHAFRHTLATELAEAGVPVHVAQKHLGHASPVVTLGIYSHARKGALQDAGAALEAHRRRA